MPISLYIREVGVAYRNVSRSACSDSSGWETCDGADACLGTEMLLRIENARLYCTME